MPSTCRENLIEAALNLFDRDGFHRTGIEAILAEAGVAKMTLYNHFRSKDDLIVAALRRRDEKYRHWFMHAVEKEATVPRERLLAAFDVVEKAAAKSDFRGCMFINAATEFTDSSSAIRNMCIEHKRLIERYLYELAVAAELSDPESLARQINLLLEGALTTALVQGSSASVCDARAIAEVLIAQHDERGSPNRAHSVNDS